MAGNKIKLTDTQLVIVVGVAFFIGYMLSLKWNGPKGLFPYTLSAKPRHPKSVELMRAIATLTGQTQRLFCASIKGAMIEAKKFAVVLAKNMEGTKGLYIADPDALVGPVMQQLRANLGTYVAGIMTPDKAALEGIVKALEVIMRQALVAVASVPNATAVDQLTTAIYILEDLIDMMCPADVKPGDGSWFNEMLAGLAGV